MTGATRRRTGSLSPPEGWLTLALVMLICATLAWAIDDARVVLGHDADTDYLLIMAILGVLVGFLGPVVGWGRWTTYLVGALFAALLAPLFTGAVLAQSSGIADPTFGERFSRTAGAVIGAVTDLILNGRPATTQTGHHVLILGLWVWASSMFASYAVFGHRRPLNAVILIGALLIGNMAFTRQDQLIYLVIFSLAALFLLIRMHTFEEQSEWLRRRIGDPTAIAGMYLRGGTVFIGVTVLSALALTNVAASAPLAGAWSEVGRGLLDWSRGIVKYLPQSGTGVALGPSFNLSAPIGNAWFTNDGLALTIEIPDQYMNDEVYWRTVAYDQLTFDGFAVTEADLVTVERAADEALLKGPEAVTEEGRKEVTFRITPSGGGDIYAPQTPVEVDVATTVRTLGTDGFLGEIDRAGGSGGYSVTSWIPVMGDDTEGALTQNRLRVAPTDADLYPPGLLDRYAQPNPLGIVGRNALAVLAEIKQEPADNPYDFAANIVRYLRGEDGRFQYDDNLEEDWAGCANSKVECFAEFRKGFCQHYASLMTALMREEGYPARVVQGFLPGDRSLTERRETVRNNRAHAWVEVYFPGYGWVDFDPTGGNLGRQIELDDIPVGAVQPSASPRPSGSVAGRTLPPEPTPTRGEPDGAGGIVTNGGGLAGPLIAVTLLLAVVVGALAVIAWRRGPRGPVTADGAYSMVTGLASRFGFGPRPNQTVYEYAGSLAEVLPSMRPELETVARAKVEVSYGGRKLGFDRIASLREAQRRLRTSLLRLAFRRRERRKRR